MQTLFLIGAAVLTIILISKIIRDFQVRNYIRSNWPKWLSEKTKIELWEIYRGDDDLGDCLVKIKTLYLMDFADFFLDARRVPDDCGERNPVIVVDDFGLSYGSEQTMSKISFESKYLGYKKFNSVLEYIRFLRS